MTENHLNSIAILGSTGSIGRQVVDVIRSNRNLYNVAALTAMNNADLLISQAVELNPDFVVIGNKAYYHHVRAALEDLPVKVFAGNESILQLMESGSFHTVFNGLTGISGLEATIAAIRNNKTIALANKEVMVAAGHLISGLAKRYGVNIIPVDSEHSAIFQCLAGEIMNPIEKVYLTASGGPFRGKKREYLRHVNKEEALRHPNWAMGDKISIDSATLMNKGLEVIEARWFFGLSPRQIEVVIHPQSVIHSIVQFEDGSMKAQMGVPDMRMPIQYALNYPRRIPSDFKRFDFSEYARLTFEFPDRESFPCLGLAYAAMERGGNIPCVLNAANEASVDLFMQGKINFTQIPEIIESCMTAMEYIENPDLEQILSTHKSTLAMALEKAGAN